MITASEAKDISGKAQFAQSGWAQLAESTIREACENGEDSATILLPLNVVEDMLYFLTDNGYEECIVTGAITGAMVTVAW